MAIYGIEGQFGSGKSSLSTYIARDVALRSAKDIAKALSISGNIVLSNIKMDKELIPNYFYFEDDKFLDVLRTCNAINDLEREVYVNKITRGGLPKRNRKKFSKFYIFFDEVGALLNNHIKLENNKTYAVYINQNRKNFEDIYIITAKGGQSNKTIRQMVDWWYYVEPFSALPILKNIGIIRRQKKDEEGKIETKSYIGRDENGDYVQKVKPLDEYVDFFRKPGIWAYYDDLHKNIHDSEKYKNIHTPLFKEIVNFKKELFPVIQKDKKYLPLKNLFSNNEKNVLSKPITKISTKSF